MLSDIAAEVQELRLVDTHEHLGLSWRPGTSPWSGAWLRTPPQPAEREWVDHGPDILQALFSMYPRIDLSLAGASTEALNRLLDPAAGEIEARFEGVRDAWQAMEHTGFGAGLKLVMRANELFAFGGDVLSPTNAVAYSIQARRSIARALEAEIAAGDLTERQANRVAHRIMRDNQYACFDIDGVRRSVVSALEAGGTLDSRPRVPSLSER